MLHILDFSYEYEVMSSMMVGSCLNTLSVLNLNCVIGSNLIISSIRVKQVMVFLIIYNLFCVIGLIHFP
jgi:hypothetical protein